MNARTTDWLDEFMGWLRECAERFTHIAAETRRAADGIERCWTDDRGREWVERAGLVQRQLDRDAEACVALAERLARASASRETGPAEGAELQDGPLTSGGPLLGSTAARRADAARGMRIATLSEGEARPPA
ncbi:MAG: hypothetical protein ACT4RN_02240 [Pseudonocardia sp.]